MQMTADQRRTETTLSPRRIWLILGALLVLITFSSAAVVLHNRSAAQRSGQTPPPGYQISIPLVLRADSFSSNPPIWADTSSTQPHEVVLFRYNFNLDVSLARAELKIFADTRYQAWLDGEWVGRGPARFTLAMREYDVYALPDLEAGEHVLAVLAQWSPDDRRSESLRPLLQGAIQGYLPDGNPLILRSGSSWKAQRSPAWRGDASLIHQWRLIGYSELLDLNQLPVDWFMPDFNDVDWPQAVLVDPTQSIMMSSTLSGRHTFEGELLLETNVTESLTSIHYTPRSIAFPVSEVVPATIIDSGVLLSGRALGELPAGTPSPYNLPFQVEQMTTFTVETSGSGTLPDEALILLDGGILDWQVVGTHRPDVYLAQVELNPGAHNLTLNPPSEGLTFDISTNYLSGLNLPFEQGNHAGRRLLLAEPASQPGAVITDPGALNAIEFTNTPAYVVLDLGRVTHGRLSAQVSGPAGTVIDIGWDERLLSDTSRPLPYPGSLHAAWNQTDSWILDGNTRQLTTIDARSGRYILIAVWGSGNIRLEDLAITSEHYPLTQMGNFYSSDPLLDQIWQVGVDTAWLNMVDAYADPWRERGQWWGDTFVIDRVNQVAFGDASLLRRGLRLMQNAFPETGAPGCAPHNNNLHMLDYAMLWVHSLADYARRTGDTALLQEAYPTLVTFMGHLASYEHPETGLLDLPEAPWSETAYIDSLGYASRYGQSTALNSIYSATLNIVAEIADTVGDAPNHDLWLDRATMVRDSVNTWLYLPAEGRYLSNIYDGVAYPPTVQAQAWPLAYGIVPDAEQKRVISALLELLSPDPAAPNVGVYGFYWILEGLGQAGYYDQGLELVRNYYGRLIDLGATTWWENFLSNLNYSNAMSHGWGGSPTWFLTTYILGSRQVSENEWLLQPAIGSLASASGTLPMPQGMLQVNWQSSGCESGTGTNLKYLELDAPVGTYGEVVIPFSSLLQEISVDGQVYWNTNDTFSNSPVEISIALGEGIHFIEIEEICAARP